MLDQLSVLRVMEARFLTVELQNRCWVVSGFSVKTWFLENVNTDIHLGSL